MYKVTIPVIWSTAYKYKEETLRELRRCRADRVAIALRREMDYRFSSEKSLEMLADVLGFFKNEGLEVLVWIGQTIGHDRANPPVKDYGFQTIRLLNGKSVFSFCPLDERFSDAIAVWIQNVARLNPDLIILDDDFRMGEHFGCCCPLHMKRFAEEVGEQVPVEGLEKLLLHEGPNKYRDAWLKVQGDGLRAMARKIRTAIDRVNKNIRLGACITAGRWDADGADPFEIGEILAGETKPFLRLFGAPYHVNAFPIGVSVERERAQLNWCKNKGFEVITEGDTYPRPRFACPAAYLECFDMMLRADGSSDGILRYMIDYNSSPAYERGYADIYESNFPVYGIIDEMFSHGSCVGVTPYLPGGTLREAGASEFYNRDNVADLTFEFGSSYGLLTENSIPSTYERGFAKVVFGESARKITKEELTTGAIIDIDAARILTERGIDVGVAEISNEPLFINEGFFSTVCEHFIDYNEDVLLEALELPKITLKPSAEVLSRVTKGNVTHDFVFRYENENGQKFLVLPFSAKKTFCKLGFVKNYLRKRQICDNVEWLSGKPLDAYIESSTPSVYMMVKKDGERLCVGLWNMFPDKANSVRVKLSKTYECATFKNCAGHLEGDVAVIDSTVYPYEFTGIILE